MAFGKRNDLKERDKRRADIEGTRRPDGVDQTRAPAVYHVFVHPSRRAPDGETITEHEKRPTSKTRRIAAALDGQGIDEDAKLLGSGLRVYKSQFAFAARHRKQIEIEALQVRGCIIVTFTNYTRRVVGLLRFNGGDVDGHLLPAFIRMAEDEVRPGDQVGFELLGGAFTYREAQQDTMMRRSKVLLALEGIVQSESSNQMVWAALVDRRIGTRWTAEDNYNLRMETWDGETSLASCSTAKRKAIQLA